MGRAISGRLSRSRSCFAAGPSDSFTGRCIARHIASRGLNGEHRAITLRPPLLRILDYGLAAGCYVDLVVWDCAKPEDIVAALPPRTLVLNRGRATIETRHGVCERWRDQRERGQA